ncbi:hypothetical protein TYRP_016647 [Tyrophagus putrescentiae]|nr:hypothetical protein TYRP_016647 [Tyrophagus putrescentiae]
MSVRYMVVAAATMVRSKCFCVPHPHRRRLSPLSFCLLSSSAQQEQQERQRWEPSSSLGVIVACSVHSVTACATPLCRRSSVVAVTSLMQAAAAIYSDHDHHHPDRVQHVHA